MVACPHGDDQLAGDVGLDAEGDHFQDERAAGLQAAGQLVGVIAQALDGFQQPARRVLTETSGLSLITRETVW